MMKIMRYLILFIFAIICFAAQPASVSAQEAPAPKELFEDRPAEQPTQIEPDMPEIPEPQDQNKKPLPFSSYDEIPQEALDDAQDFYKHCRTDKVIPTHYNCECWSQRYLEERIKLGPNASRQLVMNKINRECFDLAAAAGYAHARCEKHGIATYRGSLPPEEYCDCVGNNYALLLEQTPGFYLAGKKMGALYSSATLRCNRPPPGVPDVFPRLDQ